jgi:ABC-type glycerol-3-phosphate transport system substrate-binding protein
MVHGSISHLTDTVAAAPFRLGAVPAPSVAPDSYYGELLMLGVGADSAHPLAAMRWIAHLLSTPGQQSLAAAKLSVPVHEGVLDSPAWNDGRLHGSEALAAGQRCFRVLPDSPRYPQAVDLLLLCPLVARLYLGEIGVEEAEALFRTEHPRVVRQSRELAEKGLELGTS